MIPVDVIFVIGPGYVVEDLSEVQQQIIAEFSGKTVLGRSLKWEGDGVHRGLGNKTTLLVSFETLPEHDGTGGVCADGNATTSS